MATSIQGRAPRFTDPASSRVSTLFVRALNGERAQAAVVTALAAVPGVRDVAVNTVGARVTVLHSGDPQDLVAAASGAGYHAELTWSSASAPAS